MSNINNIMNYLADNIELTSDLTTTEETELLTKIGTLSATNFDDRLEQWIDENVGDYVVEQGTTNGWEYRKWNSGTLEQWTRIDRVFSTWSTWGGWYTGTATCTFGVNFTSTPMVTIENAGSNTSVPMVTSVTTNNFGFSACRPNAGSTSASYYFSVYAIGKWK